MKITKYIRILLIAVTIVLPLHRAGAFTVALTGDIMMGTTTQPNYLPPANGTLLFRSARQTLQTADFAFGNLEGTLCDANPEPRQCKNPDIYYVFKTPQSYAQNLADAGFDALSIANNHINDFGREGMDSTIKALKAVGIACCGLRRRCEMTIVVRNGKRVGICAFSHNSVTTDVRNIAYAVNTIKALRKKCDYVIVSFHGGAEGKDCMHVTRKTEYYVGESRGNVYEFAHACVDAGADLVFGHGPHVPRGLELYKSRLIAYSLGNFCTPYGISIAGVNGYAPLLVVNLNDEGEFVRGKIESYLQKRGMGPVVDDKEHAAYLMMRLTAQDFPENGLAFVGGIIMRREMHQLPPRFPKYHNCQLLNRLANML